MHALVVADLEMTVAFRRPDRPHQAEAGEQADGAVDGAEVNLHALGDQSGMNVVGAQVLAALFEHARHRFARGSRLEAGAAKLLDQ